MWLSVCKVVTYFITFLVAFHVMGEHESIEVLFGKRINSTVTLLDKNIHLINTVNFREHCSTEHPFYLALVSLFASYFCFKASYQACRTYLQWPSFSIPLIINLVLVPILVGLYVKPSIIANDWDFYTDGYTTGQWMIGMCGAFTFLSILMLTTYVWRNGMRIKKLEKIFAMPFYAGYAVDVTLLWSRRRLRKTRHAHTDCNKAEAMPSPFIYLCATMWHETELEMKTLLRSIFRLNRHQFMLAVKQYLEKKGKRKELNEQFYQFEAHIFFDDAFKENKKKVKPKARIDGKEKKLFPGEETNEYVTQLMKCIEETARSFYKMDEFRTSKKYRTPYGGRLEWDLIVPNFDDEPVNKSSAGRTFSSDENKDNGSNSSANNSSEKSSKTPLENPENSWTVPCKLVLHLKYKALIRKKKRWSQQNGISEKDRERFANTYILALDGDVDFKPGAVLRLLERMQKNINVGTACGRIIPKGGGPVVWYQKFEYAASHWLQKSTEHIFGCVLCTPGSFSLFRASALMSTDIIKIYTSIPSTAFEYVQFDQGEDRWLSTLLLKQGYKLEYTAASDANTFVPEGLFEFFNQRRRWSPSTLANIFSSPEPKAQVSFSDHILSVLYLVYHMFLFASSIITPGTIFLMILGATVLAFPIIPVWVAFIINITLIVIFMSSCVLAKEETQLTIAAVMSAIYALTMVVVLVGLVMDAINSGFCSVTSYFFCYVAGTFLLAALMHPLEFYNIFYGIVYFLAVPTTSMLLLIYALGNLHVTSWGTRESNKPGKIGKQKLEDPEESSCSCFGVCRCICLPNATVQVKKQKDKAKKQERQKPKKEKNKGKMPSADINTRTQEKKTLLSDADNMKYDEKEFWDEIIDKYLNPKIQEDTKNRKNY
ncbi:chitin synthase chs-2-like [Saccostrea cucullata]|uniref:chitin synthase chs-2-like n=1 Tax=Saccostrea cuccullata TaxID=36930 RepID=UPI002ED2CDBE